MIRSLLFFGILIFILSSCTSSVDKKTENTNTPKATEPFFSDKNPITVGAYYYPEHWPAQDWERDVKKMAELGFEFTHFGEFAWSSMEPEEGKFNFEWLDKNIELADKYHLKVILCTPSPTPPAWLVEKHPEILMVNENGTTMQHGSRQHASWSSPIYREYVKKIVEQLAKRYGNDARVWGWQLDNEPSHYAYPYDYCEAAQKNFKSWLEKKYKHIDSLNIRWGNAFWSQAYNSFSQIRIPNQKELVQAVNPHALLDFQEFTNQELGDFLAFQASAIRQYALPTQFITSNFAMQLPHVDSWAASTGLDFASYTNYPLNSYSEIENGELGFRLGSGRDLAITHDFHQSIAGYTGIMELQPGQINWGRYNAQPLPGAVRMWVWHAFGLGNKFICTYRFRQPRSGNEQYHQGIIQTDGISVSSGGAEYVQAIQELNQIKKQFQPKQTPKVAIVWDHKSMMDMHNFPHNQQWNAINNLYQYYTVFKSLGLQVDFIPPTATTNPKQYPMVLLPSVILCNEGMLNQWKLYAEKGGCLLMAPRTAQKNRDGHWWETKLQEKLQPILNARIEFYDHLPPGRTAAVTMNGKNYTWNTWGETISILDTTKKVNSIALHSTEFYKGKSACISTAIGSGTAVYIGITSTDFSFERDVIKTFCNKVNIPILDLPKHVYIETRGNLKIAVNYSSNNFKLPLKQTDSLLLGSIELAPGNVTVWKLK